MTNNWTFKIARKIATAEWDVYFVTVEGDVQVEDWRGSVMCVGGRFYVKSLEWSKCPGAIPMRHGLDLGGATASSLAEAVELVP